MSCPLGTDEINKLKAFIAICTATPQILNTPQLEFFKTFVEKLGGKIPAGEFKMPSFSEQQTGTPKPPTSKAAPETNIPKPEEANIAEDPESDIELDMEGVIEPDTDAPQAMGDADKAPTEEEMDEASDIRSKAAAAYNDNKFQEAIDLYTKSIELNPGNALFYAKRGQAFLKLLKPNACIRDCDRALELNCDSAAAHKFRGRANRLLGNWAEAAIDLRQACKLDFDEECDEWLREVTPNAKKIEQHNIKQERKKTENEMLKRQERMRQAKEENKRAQDEARQNAGSSAGAGPGTGGGVPPMGNVFGNMNPADLLSAFRDPEVASAMQDIMSDPANISKYQSNEKVMNLLGKLGSAMGGAGGGNGNGGGFPGAGAGFPGAGGFPFGGGAGAPDFSSDTEPTCPTGKSPPKPDFTDDGLD